MERDEDAFTELNYWYRAHVLALCLQANGRQVDTQALAQETLLKVLQHLGELQQQGKFASWMFGIESQLCAGIDRECQKQIECILRSAVSCEGTSFEVAVAIEHG